ncbi:hypothetical protein F5Y15DRAFT_418640 [Xylariaceae sp. FL0016]|nr:hypothetical protein F5Y15DRAFT_418640 [Xylariaceae sp. FL0016]
MSSSRFNDSNKLPGQGTVSSLRPRHQVKRSLTELSPPTSKASRHYHLHHHRKDRDRDDRPAISATPTLHMPRGSIDLPRSEGVTPVGIPSDTSRRLDMLSGAEDGVGATEHNVLNLTPSSRGEQVREQRVKTMAATASLKKSLVDLSTFSNTAMQRLDNTYFSVLERLSMLQSTIVAIKEIAGMAQDINRNFETESQALVNEIESQLRLYDQTEDQQIRIRDLQSRIYAGREKVEALSKRVDVVRERIEGWETADREWQERTRKRLRVLWIITLAIAFAVVLVFLGAQYVPASMDVSRVTDLASGSRNDRPLVDEQAGHSAKGAAVLANEVREALNQRRKNGSIEDQVLRAFDEL